MQTTFKKIKKNGKESQMLGCSPIMKKNVIQHLEKYAKKRRVTNTEM